MQIVNKVISAVLVGAALTLVACANSNENQTQQNPGNPSGNGYATTPQPCNVQPGNPNCIGGYTYGAPVLPQTWPNGAWQWPTQWQPNVGNCGCQTTYQPVYHQSYGMACAPQAYFSGGSYPPIYGGGVTGGYSFAIYGVSVGVFFNWGVTTAPPVNNQNLNIPQTYYGNSCQGSAAPAQGCDTRNSQSCGANRICQPAGAGSSIGVCVDDYYYYSN